METCQGRGTYPAAGGGEGGAGTAWERESYASYAVRYAASFEGVFMVLSGHEQNYEQLADNVSYMKDFQPFTSAGNTRMVERVREILKQQGQHSLYGLPLLCAGLPKA